MTGVGHDFQYTSDLIAIAGFLECEPIAVLVKAWFLHHDNF